jgi:hypothetical protein
MATESGMVGMEVRSAVTTWELLAVQFGCLALSP